MFKELILSRRSMRKFTCEDIEESFMDDLRICCYFSPSSRGIRGYKIIFVKNSTMLGDLSKAKKGAELLQGAKLAVVIIGVPEKTDVWIEDCSIVASNILNLCEEKKIGACWVQIRNRFHTDDISADEYTKKLLKIPENYSVECIIGIGKRAFIPKPYNITDIDKTMFSDELFVE
ncbi:MAG: hypothetical protein A2015_17165 [Spirochaetes bacterium GWF1_31_7]|nr:MAG: hypothetical protein A2Y30_14530 [Spirochaetes bacterium GWE1_32_154]OHD50171.1 MAG: hypothetical protein A2Y29_12575 [Spirochaetes bacterium GWE2_31_10]OHD52485.1 MAG: hypothetical protein A2015_17165 [Spirochaetes bacterium GWF1_31_7]OHD81984.1 MAG: hypothetical protein A2355_02095 [Spirochaetes bacterium RIFOXYB1_FULL_32_8]HBD94130.1 hypothetical protein [Spirochaetia bacterium]